MVSPYSGTQAISRAVALLKALGAQRSALTPQQISVLVGLNRSTVYRILSALEHDGLVVLDETRRYMLGPELVALGSSALRQISLRQVALPLLQELARRSGETVDLEILHGQQVMVVEEIIGDHLLNTSSNIGTLYPAHCTATGKLLLAYLPEDALATVLAGDLCACGPRTIAEPHALRVELAAMAARGYATAYEELEAHLHAVGAPIFDHRGQAVAAVSISGPAVRIPRRREPEIARMLIEACAQISQALGYREQVTSDE